MQLGRSLWVSTGIFLSDSRAVRWPLFYRAPTSSAQRVTAVQQQQRLGGVRWRGRVTPAEERRRERRQRARHWREKYGPLSEGARSLRAAEAQRAHQVEERKVPLNLPKYRQLYRMLMRGGLERAAEAAPTASALERGVLAVDGDAADCRVVDGWSDERYAVEAGRQEERLESDAAPLALRESLHLARQYYRRQGEWFHGTADDTAVDETSATESVASIAEQQRREQLDRSVRRILWALAPAPAADTEAALQTRPFDPTAYDAFLARPSVAAADALLRPDLRQLGAYTMLMLALARAGHFAATVTVFEVMQKRGCRRVDTVVYNVVIKALAHLGEVERIVMLIAEMQRRSDEADAARNGVVAVEPDARTFLYAMVGCARRGDAEAAERLARLAAGQQHGAAADDEPPERLWPLLPLPLLRWLAPAYAYQGRVAETLALLAEWRHRQASPSSRSRIRHERCSVFPEGTSGVPFVSAAFTSVREAARRARQSMRGEALADTLRERNRELEALRAWCWPDTPGADPMKGNEGMPDVYGQPLGSAADRTRLAQGFVGAKAALLRRSEVRQWLGFDPSPSAATPGHSAAPPPTPPPPPLVPLNTSLALEVLRMAAAMGDAATATDVLSRTALPGTDAVAHAPRLYAAVALARGGEWQAASTLLRDTAGFDPARSAVDADCLREVYRACQDDTLRAQVLAQLGVEAVAVVDKP